MISQPFYLKFFKEKQIRALLTLDIKNYLIFDKKEISIGDVFYDNHYHSFFIFSFSKQTLFFEGVNGFGFLEIIADSKDKMYKNLGFKYFSNVIDYDRDLKYIGNLYIDKNINKKALRFEKKNYTSYNYESLIYEFTSFSRNNIVKINFKEDSLKKYNSLSYDSLIELYKEHKKGNKLEFNILLSNYFTDYTDKDFYKGKEHLFNNVYSKPVIDAYTGSIYSLIKSNHIYKKMLKILEIDMKSKRKESVDNLSYIYFLLDTDGYIKIKNENGYINKLIINPSVTTFYYHYPENENDDSYIDLLLKFI